MISDLVIDWINGGAADAIEARRGVMPWDAIAREVPLSHLILRTAHAAPWARSPTNNGRCDPKVEAAMSALLRLAVEDGRHSIFETQRMIARDIRFVGPIMGLMVHGFLGPLQIYLDNGFDPLKKMGADQMSALEVAEELGLQEVAGLFRARLARGHISQVLNEIDASASAAAGSP